MKSVANLQSIEISRSLESWYARPAGEELCTSIRDRLQSILDLSFDYHIPQLSPVPTRSLISGSRIRHHIHASPAQGFGASLCCHGDELPLESDSVDMLVAFHALEFDEHPHGCLREMQRVLRPNGHLVIIGFNPLSVLGVSQYLRGFRGSSLWHRSRHQPVSLHRLTDWLHLLDCEIAGTQQLFPLPLVGQGRLRTVIGNIDHWAARHNLPGGSVYIAHAIKQIAGLRRPRPQPVRAKKRLLGLPVTGSPAPTPRQPRSGRSDLAA